MRSRNNVIVMKTSAELVFLIINCLDNVFKLCYSNFQKEVFVMTKEEVMNDMNFRRKCGEYALDWRNFEVYGDIIVLATPKNSVNVLFDKNYNTVGIYKKSVHNFQTPMEVMTVNYKEAFSSNNILPFPFQNISLKQIMDLANRIGIHEMNHGHSALIEIDGHLLVGEDNKTYLGLVSYIKFLGELVKQHFLTEYRMKILGFDYPSVYTYIDVAVSSIKECIDENNEKRKRTFLVNIMECLGKAEMTSEEQMCLYNIIELLSAEYSANNDEELSALTNTLARMLEVIDEVDKEIGKGQMVLK